MITVRFLEAVYAGTKACESGSLSIGEQTLLWERIENGNGYTPPLVKFQVMDQGKIRELGVGKAKNGVIEFRIFDEHSEFSPAHVLNQLCITFGWLLRYVLFIQEFAGEENSCELEWDTGMARFGFDGTKLVMEAING